MRNFTPIIDNLADDVTLQLPLEGAVVTYTRCLSYKYSVNEIFHRLLTDTPWESKSINLAGRHVKQPRLTTWYADKNYTYSGLTLHPTEWTPLLLDIKETVEESVGDVFNGVLLNYYRNHNDSIGFHSDDEQEFGENPTIASVSFGERRTFIFRHTNREEPGLKLDLHSGSLLVMKAGTQQCWQHGINKQKTPCGPRINLTFRKLI